MKRPWTGIVPDEDERRYQAAGPELSRGIGARPALLVIDTQYRTIGTQELPFWGSVAQFKTSCGDSGWDAVRHIAPLIEAFRASDLPIVFPHVAPAEILGGDRFTETSPSDFATAIEGYRFIEQVAPEQGEILLPRSNPSAFFGTSLVGTLIAAGVDSVVIVGCGTGSAVRSSVVDAFSYQLKVTVAEDCVYDRSPLVHAISLFDMAYHYADVRPLVDVLAQIDALHEAGSTAAA